VLTIFAAAFVRLADHLPARDRADSQGLDTGIQTRDDQESGMTEADLS
jgi:hypothetical protein